MTSRRISSLQKKAEIALKQAVRHVVEEHKQRKEPLVIWKNGKVKLIPATSELISKLK